MSNWKILTRGIIVLLTFSPEVMAQGVPSLPDSYSEKTIYLYGTNRYVKNNVLYTGHRSLLSEFTVSPGGLDLYLRSRRNRNIGMAVSLLGTAGSVFALLNRNRVDWRPFFWVSLGTGLIAAPLNLAASKQLNQAVWLRNRDALLNPDGLNPSGAP